MTLWDVYISFGYIYIYILYSDFFFGGGEGCFNATFSNISAISWRPVLVVEEARVPRQNHQPWASNWKTLSLAAAGANPHCIGDRLV
jgi:hypothetical protein